MTGPGRNHRRGRGRWVPLGSGVDDGFQPSQEPGCGSNFKDDGVQDSNFRVPNNQLDKASVGADRYCHHRSSQHWKPLPKREGNSSSKCTESATMVASSYHQDAHILPSCLVGKESSPDRAEGSNSRQPINSSVHSVDDKESHAHSGSTIRSFQKAHRSRNQSNSPHLDSANLQDRICVSKDIPSTAGKTDHVMITSENLADHLSAEHSEKLPLGCRSNVKDDGVQDSSCRVPDNQLDNAPVGAGSDGRYSHHRSSQHEKSLSKREANSSSKCTQSEAVVDSLYQQDVHNLPPCSFVKERSPNIEIAQKDYIFANRPEGNSSRQPNNSLVHSVNDNECLVQSDSRHSSFQKAQLSEHQSNSPNLASSNLRDRLCIGQDIPSAAGKTDQMMISSKKAADHLQTEHLECLPFDPFDICQRKTGSLFALKPSLLAQNREKRRELEYFERSEKLILRQGMVLLKKYISHTNQIKIIKECRELGLGPGGFYQPGYRDGAKLHLQMMCLGKDWDPEFRSYGERRKIDGACPPCIPVEFKKLVEDAIQDSNDFIKGKLKLGNVEEVLPVMSPDICIVNFYTHSGRLGLHQDRDESQESLNSGLPVVSFSIGDSAEFLYGENSDTEMAEKVILESGDVLIFGGNSRLVYHGVRCIMPNSAPSFLVEEANLRPGRINLTFRKS
ncbi:uncharacterized protein LOC122061573 [Macadamia integrifolia]|uniref:uncharacterized protein LOC122061573 n=1 Tax=Macadamia integrifolia TaxID=60698 RepID=UPI001C52ADD7|nr:uncharacterized protein LOC122061573 [Macadamia integrifolia]